MKKTTTWKNNNLNSTNSLGNSNDDSGTGTKSRDNLSDYEDDDDATESVKLKRLIQSQLEMYKYRDVGPRYMRAI